ncbi:MAG TPA: tetratricopeptide repeat protein [Candidatus Polarisedimenticolaceae bacterium]|nr:tetratricopeptide repeat protein [Candidatus Polarisedimenticolaceae bacterium]
MTRVLLVPLVLASLLSPFGGKAHRKTEEANRHYELGEFGEALADYTEAQVVAPESPRLHYDVGNVLYRQGDYEGAAEAFTRALVTAPDELAPLAAFNLGNARFQQREYGDAADAYRRALEGRPDDADAKRNLELALRALEQQEQQPQQDSQQDPSEDPQPQDQPQQGPGQDAEPPESDSGERGGEPPPKTGEERSESEAQPSGMTPEQAERLLDSLADEERDNLERERRRKAAAARERRLEKDW